MTGPGQRFMALDGGPREMLSDPDREKAGRVMDAMLQMKKIDIEGLRRAYRGG